MGCLAWPTPYPNPAAPQTRGVSEPEGPLPPYFGGLSHGELRRTPLPRTRVDRGNKEKVGTPQTPTRRLRRFTRCSRPNPRTTVSGEPPRGRWPQGSARSRRLHHPGGPPHRARGRPPTPPLRSTPTSPSGLPPPHPTAGHS